MRNFLLIPVVFMMLALIISPTYGYAAADSKASADEAVHQPENAGAIENVLPLDSTNPLENAPESAHAAEAGHDKGGLPQLNIATYPSQVFWLLVMFAVLYMTFSKSILPTIGGVVDAREAMIKSNLDGAQSLKEQVVSIQAAYEKHLEIAKSNASKAVTDVELSAKKKAADQVDMFRKKADEEILAAETRVLSAKSKAMGDMTSVAAEVASVAAEKITGINTDRQNAQAIVENIASKAKAA
jgi:F-type H+-transporting ATPase subunit b